VDCDQEVVEQAADSLRLLEAIVGRFDRVLAKGDRANVPCLPGPPLLQTLKRAPL
jgi:hypothetical protein